MTRSLRRRADALAFRISASPPRRTPPAPTVTDEEKRRRFAELEAIAQRRGTPFVAPSL